MNAFVPLSVLAFLVVLASSAGLLGAGRAKMDLAELTVGKHSLGRVFLWLLMAGENYTSYTFLGAAGWAYGKGIRAFYVFCSFTIACVISYFILPPMWKTAKDFNLLTNADYLQTCYSSSWLGAFSALVGIVALIPFITFYNLTAHRDSDFSAHSELRTSRCDRGSVLCVFPDCGIRLHARNPRGCLDQSRKRRIDDRGLVLCWNCDSEPLFWVAYRSNSGCAARTRELDDSGERRWRR